MNGLAGLMVAGLLVIPVPGGIGSQAWAQSGSGLTEPQGREREQKYQEQWDYLERLNKEQEDAGARLEKAEQRRQEAERRQREAERRLQELEQQKSTDKTE